MSIETWMNEFISKDMMYDLSKESMVDNTLRKFKGCLPENLKKHNVQLTRKEGSGIGLPCLIDEEGESYSFSCYTCVYCLKYVEDFCKECPLTQVEIPGLSKGRCFEEGGCFNIFYKTGNVRYMIEVLEEVKRKESGE